MSLLLKKSRKTKGETKPKPTKEEEVKKIKANERTFSKEFGKICL